MKTIRKTRIQIHSCAIVNPYHDLPYHKNKEVLYCRFQINCTFLPKSEFFYTADVKNLGERYKISL
jgi:hypothetical protein